MPTVSLRADAPCLIDALRDLANDWLAANEELAAFIKKTGIPWTKKLSALDDAKHEALDDAVNLHPLYTLTRLAAKYTGIPEPTVEHLAFRLTTPLEAEPYRPKGYADLRPEFAVLCACDGDTRTTKILREFERCRPGVITWHTQPEYAPTSATTQSRDADALDELTKEQRRLVLFLRGCDGMLASKRDAMRHMRKRYSSAKDRKAFNAAVARLNAIPFN